MRLGKLIWLLLLIPIFLGIIIPGCSDKTFTSTTTAVSQNADPTAYLPLEQGLRVNYVILEPETRYYDVEVANPVSIAGNLQWRLGKIRVFDRTVKRIGLVVCIRVGVVRKEAHFPILMVVVHGTFGCVYGKCFVMRSETVSVRIAVRKDPRLQHLVR